MADPASAGAEHIVEAGMLAGCIEAVPVVTVAVVENSAAAAAAA